QSLRMYPLDWVFIMYAIYIPLAIATYLLEVNAILQYRRNHFKSSFFTIFCVLAVVSTFQIWDKACLVCISACAIVAVAPVWFLFDDPARFLLTRDRSISYQYYYVQAAANFKNSIWYNMVIVTLISNGLSSLLYGACIVRLCRIKGARNVTAERNMFLVGFCSMICSLPYMTGMV
ncbi:hypothetical protein PENTCL1PPCAC_956, partial [Pristionchus entomophagus]